MLEKTSIIDEMHLLYLNNVSASIVLLFWKLVLFANIKQYLSCSKLLSFDLNSFQSSSQKEQKGKEDEKQIFFFFGSNLVGV